MIIAMAIVSLLIYAYQMFSSYQASKQSLADIESTAEFNEQFAQYQRDDVLGYELLSLINKIQDYDERQTTDTIEASNEKYTPIKIKVILDNGANDYSNRKNLAFDFDTGDEPRLFKKEYYEEGDLTSASGRIEAEIF